MQMPARTPAMTAMTAATLDLHERRPLPARARALRAAGRRGLARSAVRQAAGQDPRVRRHRAHDPRARGAARAPRRRTTTSRTRDRTRPGSASRSRSSCTRAAPTSRSTSRPSGRRTSSSRAEIADGWLPIFFSPYPLRETYGAALDAGFAKAGDDKSLADFDIAPTVTVHRRRRRRHAAAGS